MYEAVRAKVVLTFTLAAGAAISPSVFGFPLFGPVRVFDYSSIVRVFLSLIIYPVRTTNFRNSLQIMCGTVGGCGGAFLPLNKGLDPVLSGMQPPMTSACVGATLVHLFMNTSLSEGIVDAKEKAHLHLAVFFILVGLVNGLNLGAASKVKKE